MADKKLTGIDELINDTIRTLNETIEKGFKELDNRLIGLTGALEKNNGDRWHAARGSMLEIYSWRFLWNCICRRKRSREDS